jgi:hypothetical protein
VGRWSSRGHDAGKKVNGRRRHIAVDTNRLPHAVPVTMAGIQDRDAGQRRWPRYGPGCTCCPAPLGGRANAGQDQHPPPRPRL